MTTIQDRIQTLKNILFANGVKCDSKQFLIEDINNLIKEVQEETRKETIDKYFLDAEKRLSITNKENKNER